MFDEPTRVWRPVRPPQLVIVRMSTAFPPATLTWAKGLPLWVRSGGFDVAAEARGSLHGWALSSTGRWWALVSLHVSAVNGQFGLDITQMVPAESVRPAG